MTVSNKMALQDSEHSDISDSVDIEDAIEEFPFERRPGIIADIPNNATPLDLFSLLFSDKILDHVVDRTNRYAERLLEEPNILRKSIKKWVALSRDELKRFLAVSLLMGEVKIITIRHYFCCKGLYVVPAFSKIMSGRKYQMIVKHLHMDSDENDDPLSKVRPIIDLLIGNIRSCYYPDQNLSLDELMMAWRERLRFRQYIKGKKHKFGIKFYALYETTGFVLNFVIYEGKSTVTEDDEGDGHCQKIVMKLMQPYLDKGHGLYMDNFYNSVDLSELLHNRKTHIIGTLIPIGKTIQRALPKKKLKKCGEACWMRRGPVYVSK